MGPDTYLPYRRPSAQAGLVIRAHANVVTRGNGSVGNVDLPWCGGEPAMQIPSDAAS